MKNAKVIEFPEARVNRRHSSQTKPATILILPAIKKWNLNCFPIETGYLLYEQTMLAVARSFDDLFAALQGKSGPQ